MERTAEEFVHRLPDGRWFVGDFVVRNDDGEQIFLVEPRKCRGGVELTIDVIASPAAGARTYARKSSAKRAAQKMIERVLDDSEQPALPARGSIERLGTGPGPAASKR